MHEFRSLSKCELWILDVIATGGLDIVSLFQRDFFKSKNYSSVFFEDNTLATKLEAISKLHLQGLIAFEEVYSTGYPHEHLIRQRLRNLTLDEQLWNQAVFITPSGGELWEYWAEPDWHLYFIDTYPDSSDDDWLETAMEPKSLFIDLTWSGENPSRQAELVNFVAAMHNGEVAKTFEQQVFSPWEPFVWKSLPTGTSLRVQLQLNESDAFVQRRDLGFAKDFDAFRKWRKRGFSNDAYEQMAIDP